MKLVDLKLDEVVADPDQPRKLYDQEAMRSLSRDSPLGCHHRRRWGQLQPIRVREAEDGAMEIVDGERRWKAMKVLSERYPDDGRFQRIRAIVQDGVDESRGGVRKAIQLTMNNGEHLAPTEKAHAVKAITQDRRKPSDEELTRQCGISKGELRFLKALASAPERIQVFGRPRVYEVEKTRDGEVVMTEGKPEREPVERPPLGLWLIVEVITMTNSSKRPMVPTSGLQRMRRARSEKLPNRSSGQKRFSRGDAKRCLRRTSVAVPNNEDGHRFFQGNLFPSRRQLRWHRGQANADIVNFMRSHSISEAWGSGTTASSDAMSLETSRHLWIARVDPRHRRPISPHPRPVGDHPRPTCCPEAAPSRSSD